MHGHREPRGQTVHAKKRLGQNFLTDEALLEALCRDAGVEEQDCVLEIGPGMGALTRPLSRAARQVAAVEIDGTLIPVSYTHLDVYKRQKLRIARALVSRIRVGRIPRHTAKIGVVCFARNKAVAVARKNFVEDIAEGFVIPCPQFRFRQLTGITEMCIRDRYWPARWTQIGRKARSRYACRRAA